MTRIIQEVNVMEEDTRVYVLTEFTITPGKVDEFKAIFQILLEVVKEKEPNTLRYLCYFDKDQNRSFLVEEYPNAGALRAHITHVGMVLPKLMKISKPKFTVLGKPNLPAREILSASGGQMFTYCNGLAR